LAKGGGGVRHFFGCKLLVFWLNRVIFNLSQQVLHNIVAIELIEH